jgi:hypothetical protein
MIKPFDSDEPIAGGDSLYRYESTKIFAWLDESNAEEVAPGFTAMQEYSEEVEATLVATLWTHTLAGASVWYCEWLPVHTTAERVKTYGYMLRDEKVARHLFPMLKTWKFVTAREPENR